MKALFYLLLILFCTLCIQAQEVLVSDSNGSIYTLDLRDCSTTFVVDIANELKPNDITFHPNGNLYGINSSGVIYKINLTTGATTDIVDLPVNQSFNSLTCDADGLFYATGDDGFLLTYDLSIDKYTNLGSFNYDATGDLIFYKGNLYVATKFDKIIRINLGNVSNSSIVISKDKPGVIYGLVSFSENCRDFNVFANSSNGDVYLVDFANKLLKFNCAIDIEVYGGASMYEFFDSTEPITINSLNLISPTCNDSGEIEIIASGRAAPFKYAINNGDFQMSNVFKKLPIGVYSIKVEDTFGCQITEGGISILGINCQVVVPNAFSPNNDGVNDAFSVIAIEDIDATIKTFNIYNRWGLLIYQNSNIGVSSTEASWDGTYKNKAQEIGVYLYYIELDYIDGSNEVLEGSVTLIR